MTQYNGHLNDNQTDADSYQNENGENMSHPPHSISKNSSSAKNFAQQYHVNLIPGKQFKSKGNWLVESIVDQINNRDVFANKMLLSPQYYHLTWVNISEVQFRQSPFYPGSYDEEKWIRNWEKLRRDGSFDIDYFGELYRIGMIHCVGKIALVINTYITEPRNRMSVIKPDLLKGNPDTEYPLILAFDGVKYESLIPRSELDETICKFIAREWAHGSDPEQIKTMAEHIFSPPKRMVFAKERYDPYNPYHDSADFVLKQRITPGKRPTLKRKLDFVSAIPITSKTFKTYSDYDIINSNNIDERGQVIEQYSLRYKNKFRTSSFNPVPEEEDGENRQPTFASVGNSGSGTFSAIPDLMTQGIRLARRYYIGLKPGTPNGGAGNCSFQSVLDQLNSRSCYPETYDNPCGHPFYRHEWMSETEQRARESAFYPGDFTDSEWIEAWSRLKNDGEFEIDYFGDLMMIGIMHCVRKNALVFHVSKYRAHGPMVVIRGDHFGRTVAEDVPPLVLAYDGLHYESLVPKTEQDIGKTLYLVNEWNKFTGNDMFEHLSQLDWFMEGMEGEGEKETEAETQIVVETKRNAQSDTDRETEL